MKTTIDTLNELPGLAAEVWLTREAKNPGGDTPHTSKPKPMSKPPTDLAVLDALRHDTKGLLARLTTCVRGVVEHAGWDAIPDLEEIPTWVSETSWLLATVSIWQDDEFLNDYVTSEVEQVRRDLATLARDYPPAKLYCNQSGCHALIHPMDGWSWMRCENGHAIQHHAEIKRYADTQPVNLAAVSVRTGIPASTLHRWHKTGWISPVRKSGREFLFDADAVQRTADKVRDTPINAG